MNDKKITEEHKAALWCFGRLDDLAREGLIGGGGKRITGKGRAAYQVLIATGYKPAERDIRGCLAATDEFRPEDVDKFVHLMLSYPMPTG